MRYQLRYIRKQCFVHCLSDSSGTTVEIPNHEVRPTSEPLNYTSLYLNEPLKTPHLFVSRI